MSEWDPWKRFEKGRERRYWDPYYRIEYERERYFSDPWYRFDRDRERYFTDPFFKIERDMDRLSWDPYYRTEKWREWKHDSGAMFRDRVLLDIDKEETSRELQQRREEHEWLEIARVKAYAKMYGPSIWDYIKLGFSLFMLGGLAYWLLTFRLPLP